MEKVLNVLKNALIGVWIVVAIFVTVCLLSYNEFKVPVLGKTTLLIIDNEELEPDYKDGDLVTVKRGSDKKIEIGDTVFFYNGIKTDEYLVNIGEVTDKETVTSTETTYFINDSAVSGAHVIGRTEDANIMNNMGLVLNIFTSQWGFMFLIILPTLFALVYEVVTIAGEVKKAKKEL